MKSTLIAVLVCASATGAWAADTTNKKITQKKAAAPAPPKEIVIPKDAVPNGDNFSYTWTDKDGKKWIFARSPFGTTKNPAPEQSPDAGVDHTLTKAIDKGDTVRFEHPSPFGTTAYEKKKTELTDDERKIFDAQHPKTEQNSAQPD
jgi:hypothetical protein